MGAGVFSIGFFMLILGLMDLLRLLDTLNLQVGDRILLYIGGLFLCVLGYIMARRLPRAPLTAPASFPQSDLVEPVQPLPPTDDTI